MKNNSKFKNKLNNCEIHNNNNNNTNGRKKMRDINLQKVMTVKSVTIIISQNLVQLMVKSANYVRNLMILNLSERIKTKQCIRHQ